MDSKKDLQWKLKDRYGININISDGLSNQECQNTITFLESEPTMVKLIKEFLGKNIELTHNNQQYGRQRSQAEKKLAEAKQDYEVLEASILEMETSSLELIQRKITIEQTTASLEQEIQDLTVRSKSLEKTVTTLKSEKQKLVVVNDELKRDNRRLINMVDMIRLKFAKEVKILVKYEDSEIRKALIKMYKSTLG